MDRLNTNMWLVVVVLLLGIIPFKALGQKEQVNYQPQLNTTNIKEVVAAMSLEEKIDIVVGPGMGNRRSTAVIGRIGGAVPGAAGRTNAIPRLGIPSTILADGPAGLRIDPKRKNDDATYYATAWPTGALLASSWDTDLVQKVGASMGNEVLEYGVDILLAPGVNIQRNPLNGRNYEYYSEDPYLTGHIGSAMINGIQSNGVGTSIKHFVANNQETNRQEVDAIVGERALREIYLKGFKIAIKNSNPWTVMTAYNQVNGKYASENDDLLIKILREDWGFDGYTVTDWFGGKNRVAQMWAGNNMLQPGGRSQKSQLMEAVENGTLKVEDLDRNVECILNIIVKTPSFKQFKFSNKPDLKAHADLARSAAAESMVMLKNNGALPLKKETKVALFGVTSYNIYIGGTGSGDVNEAYSVSIAEGLEKGGFIVDESLKAIYTSHIENDLVENPKLKKASFGVTRLIPELELEQLVDKYASVTDVAIYTIGRNAGEHSDRRIDNDFNLSDIEKENIRQISDAFHRLGKKLIVLINSGGVIETTSWKNNTDAILLCWQPGQEAGNAVADIINGTDNPSGKLTITFPEKYEDTPSAKSFPGIPVEKPDQAFYEEGIYVGYRYFNSFNVTPSYEFGYGLSYTTFEYSGLSLSKSKFKDSIDLEFTITNIGERAGKEVAQLYLSAPSGKLDKPSAELRKFAKTRLLQPGESQTISFTLKGKDLASFDTERSMWIAEPGEYKVNIGASSVDFRLSEIFKVKKEIEVEKVNKALVPLVDIQELSK
ncbi:glycoside hydrolase family 3 C-terminal domain-containing protein [Plebeiibacterium marinum]|uniref:Glycoside hydrolase family 3 C-terminal domain-containing protein n=1 Tax=Plebeiibacterium marinum TaxID=2992111 RepID=A0AAE3SIA4_9BACT|nr:glycoside hydrolase family 3 C-terminal domain-containing protein [Plebeiobacterium marinum]MCW3804515.1 glycoside hydrolase family 3 C-terminal domain-containing protein [Plebeiobacterium marinum]